LRLVRQPSLSRLARFIQAPTPPRCQIARPLTWALPNRLWVSSSRAKLTMFRHGSWW
jgi:hypothetical protein